MRICLLTPNYSASAKKFPKRIFAPREFANNLVYGLLKRGHKVYYATAPDILTLAEKIPGDEDLLFRQKLTIDKFWNRRTISDSERYIITNTKKLYYELDLTERTITLGNQNKLDIIHADYPLVHFFEKFSKVPVVYTLHDRLPHPGTLEYWILSKYQDHKFISISKSQMKDSNLNLVGTVLHGLDINKYRFNCNTNQNHFAFIGRFVPDKGAHTAVKVASRTGILLYLATELERKDSLYYKNEIAPFVDKAKIKIFGYLVKGKVDFFQHAKALLFPIEWEEPFGLVMIEAMACGTPVIAYGRGSVPEVVVDGVTGFVVEPEKVSERVRPLGDPERVRPLGRLRPDPKQIIKTKGIEGLVEAVKRINGMSEEEYGKMRQSCRKHVVKNFSREIMAVGYEKIYEQVIKHYRK